MTGEAKRVCKDCKQTLPENHNFFYSRLRNGKVEFQTRCRKCQSDFRSSQRFAKNPPVLATHKKCPKCKIVYPANLDHFYERNRDGKTYLTSMCKICRSNDRKKYREIEGMDSLRSKARKYRETNPSRELERKRKWRERNKTLVVAYSQNRRARVKSARGSFTADDIEAIRSQQNNKCLYCNCQIGGYESSRMHVDHFIPLSRGGDNLKNNLVVSCQKCNNEKHSKLPWEWLPDIFEEGITADTARSRLSK